MEENTTVNQQENIDSVLNSVSDEYLAKKKRNRKISFSIISLIVLALSVVIIVMSCVKVNTKPMFINNAVRYEITVSSNTTVYEKGEDAFDEFNKEFEEAFSLNYLTALFSGKLGGYDIIEREGTKTPPVYHNDTKNNTGMSSTLRNYLGNNYVRVVFGETKQVKKSNGEVYKSEYNTNYDLTFEELYFPLQSESDENELTFYLGTTNKALNNVRITKIVVKANSYSLYEFVTED